LVIPSCYSKRQTSGYEGNDPDPGRGWLPHIRLQHARSDAIQSRFHGRADFNCNEYRRIRDAGRFTDYARGLRHS